MTTQSEQTLENNLLDQLEGMEYERVQIPDETALLANLKHQIERHNEIELSEKEFERILNHLNKGNVFDRAKILRDQMHLIRDGKPNAYIEFINQNEWCQNTFQVANQITQEGDYKNRYDVTILINGLPLVQIELKRRGLELKEAFNQVNRYRRHSYGSSYGLFQYIQIFVISNGVNTKYYANTVSYRGDKKASFKQTFHWADADNKNINQLDEFAKTFLERCHLAKMITKYIVLHESDKILMVLRPYQYYAVEAIVDRVKNSTRNGYIWHTTGSGKTLTSFKASQIMTQLPEVDKVLFVVDRNDLDYQTIKEFNAFKEGSVDGTDDTRSLTKQFEDPDTPLIVTTIQKLNNAIKRDRYLEKMEPLRDKNVVFIFDECHRSQFGETHQRIDEFFSNKQMFGFTGTPIFKENASQNERGMRTTADLFDKRLHEYVITDAIADENVLKFSVEYVGKYKHKRDSANDIDIDVEGIDTKELMESPERLEKIADYVITNHDRKTHAREFTAIMCVSSVDVLTKYYDIFRAKKALGEHNLRIATIFSYQANEEDKAADGLLDEEISFTQTDIEGSTLHSRDKLESYIQDYNQMFGSKYTTKDSTSYYNYYRDIAKKVKAREIDILLVVNMFLTGFDSKTLNTLYVDKNLRYHGLIQAYSRTNRILNDTKSQGNIVVFRNLKSKTDEAMRLFADKDAEEKIFIKPYEDYIETFNEELDKLRSMASTPSEVDELVGEQAELDYVTQYRELIRLRNVLVSFADFSFEDVNMSEQEFEDYKSKYLDLYHKAVDTTEKDKVSILNDVDFELDLIRRDDINVDYILRLLARYVEADESEKATVRKTINDMLSREVQLHSKRDLIMKFIDSNLPEVKDPLEVEAEFDKFWNKEKEAALKELVDEEDLDFGKVQELINSYLWTNKMPRKQQVVSALKEQPGILERESLIEKITRKLRSYFDTFVDDV